MRDTIQNIAGGNRITYLLASVLLLSVSYPFSETGTVAAILFIGIYLVLTGSAIYLVSSNHYLLIGSVLLATIIAITGGITVVSDYTAPLWIHLMWNASLIIQMGLIVTLLVIFIIQSEMVTRDILYSAVAIYFIFAAIFGRLYSTIEILTPESFLSASGAEITWQRLNYFSLVTISTLGYGDIVPVAPAAQSLSAMEASLGTLYIAILIGRFVSLYQQDAQRSE